MPILTIIITLALIGFILWAVTTYVPMPPMYQRLFVGIVCLCVVLWLLQVFGAFSSLHSVGVLL